VGALQVVIIYDAEEFKEEHMHPGIACFIMLMMVTLFLGIKYGKKYFAFLISAIFIVITALVVKHL
jgi:hypothetical protein